jgi:hypothetical protein
MKNCALQARGHWFEPSCAHQVRGYVRWPTRLSESKLRAEEPLDSCDGSHVGFAEGIHKALGIRHSECFSCAQQNRR